MHGRRVDAVAFRAGAHHEPIDARLGDLGGCVRARDHAGSARLPRAAAASTRRRRSRPTSPTSACCSRSRRSRRRSTIRSGTPARRPRSRGCSRSTATVDVGLSADVLFDSDRRDDRDADQPAARRTARRRPTNCGGGVRRRAAAASGAADGADGGGVDRHQARRTSARTRPCSSTRPTRARSRRGSRRTASTSPPT